MNKTQKIKFGNVDISQPHFLISHSPEYGCEGWAPIGVLSTARTVEEMRLALLVHDIKDRPAIDLMIKELSFYLSELKEDDQILYLIYHCSTISNIYSNIHFSYIESINKNNIIYYILTESKLNCIYNNKSFSDINQRYLDITVNKLFADALNKNSYNDSYNDTLYYFHDLIFKKVPSVNNFEIHDQPTVLEFAKLLSGMEIDKFCNILNYLKKIKLVKINEIDSLLNFFNVNRRL